MLLFIIIPASFAPRFVNFNTSHVTVYHKGTQLRKEQTKNFNTSHVTVYRRHTGNDHAVSEFQYISCYCLSIRITIPFYSTKISIHLMLLFIGFALYESGNTMVFQYISCYCLSQPPICILLCKSSFQYISCYCLSDSHCMSLETQWYFNTSHVTVYLCISIPECVYIRISIHLMLLFIRDIIKQAKKFGIFQYISCYCLSLQGKLLQFV